MKILLISNMWPSDDDPAYGSFVRDLAGKINEHENVEVVESVLSSTKKGFFVPLKYGRLLISALYNSLTVRPDIIYCHYLFPTGFIGYLLKLLTGKPLVVTCHGSDVYIADRSAKLGKLISATLNKTDKLVVVSSSLACDLEQRFPLAQTKTEVINCGVDQDIFKPSSGSQVQERASYPVILFVGALNDNKNIMGLISAFAGLDIECRLRIVGKGPLKEVIVSKADELGISNRVELVGAVDKSALPPIYREADVLVMPSFKEAFGLVALEAMACGTPVIVSNRGGLIGLVEDGSSGLHVDPDNIGDITNAMMKILTDDKFRQRIVAEGLKTAGQNSIQHQASKLVKLFEDLRRS